MQTSKRLLAATLFILALLASCKKTEPALLPEEDSSDFVLLTDVIPDAILEIRYYSSYNFIGDRIPGYEEPIALLTRRAADSLKVVSDELLRQGYRLKIFDAYRPQCSVDYFMTWAKDTADVRMKDYFYPELDKSVLIPQEYIAEKSGHTRGSTVDLTLFDMKAEREVDMGCTFDYFGMASHPDVLPGQEVGAYQPISEEQYRHRMILRDAMLHHGFKPYDCEWWHFTLADEPYPDTYFTFPISTQSVKAVRGEKRRATKKSSGFALLDKWTEQCKSDSPNALGYPGNYHGRLDGFYDWYTANGMGNILINNAGDPFEEAGALSSGTFEREVIEFFAPLYGFDKSNLWGIVTMSGTDGNNHGIYFGVNYLKKKTGKEPVVYVSDEAHYSNYRLCDLQNLDVRLVKSNDMGQMLPDSLEAALDTSRPCLMIYAMGSTFKGAIDDQQALNEVLARHPEMEVYRHVDAALFGGYLPFTSHKALVDSRVNAYESISISGHKFFGIDSPCGLFITTREIYDNQASFDVEYLNADMRMISCSRSGTDPLKFWWLIKTVGVEGWSRQAGTMMDNTAYLTSELKRQGWPCWNNEYSNTVFFARPDEKLVSKYNLACRYDERFGGPLAHIVVMQHVSRETIDAFIEDLGRYQ